MRLRHYPNDNIFFFYSCWSIFSWDYTKDLGSGLQNLKKSSGFRYFVCKKGPWKAEIPGYSQ